MVIRYLALLLVCQLAGEVISVGFRVPVPGPVIGMVLLFAGLATRARLKRRADLPEDLETAAGGLLQHLSLLFVPAGVGVMLHVPRLAEEWLPIAAALIGSAVVTIAVTALTMTGLARLAGETPDKAERRD